MKTLSALCLLMGLALAAAGQVQNAKELVPDKPYENILVRKLHSDAKSSTFVIWVKQSVKAHKHAEHTENLYVLEGKGEMSIGDSSYTIKKGDIITIPVGTVHSLKVLSRKPVKVISIQSPEFLGNDRIFVE